LPGDTLNARRHVSGRIYVTGIASAATTPSLDLAGNAAESEARRNALLRHGSDALDHGEARLQRVV
jgi:hypothetical protein